VPDGPILTLPTFMISDLQAEAARIPIECCDERRQVRREVDTLTNSTLGKALSAALSDA
jgi:hypothetical protein